jgi:SM-20-related protein
MEFFDDEVWLKWIDLLSEQDYVVADNFLPQDIFYSVSEFFAEKLRENDFQEASVGAGTENKIISEIRGDYTYWLDNKRDGSISRLFYLVEELISKLNRYCYLSLADYELHLAHYPAGTFYKKHVDQIRDRSNRMITVIIYFNKDWKPGDGGELKMYLKDREEIIAPFENRLVLFKSAEIPHEVLKTNKARLSLTGWLLYQPSGVGYLFT